MSFMTPSMADDLEVFSRGTTYITLSAISVDGQPHSVQFYYENTASIAISNYSTTVFWSRQNTSDGIGVSMRIGASLQNVTNEKGDMTRISWGFFYVVIPKEEDLQTSMTAFYRTTCAFATGKRLPPDDTSGPRPGREDWPVLAAVWDLGRVQDEPVYRHMVVFLDDIYSINYYDLDLPPLWRNTYNYDAMQLARQALKDYNRLVYRTNHYNSELMANLTNAAGWRYAAVTALAYRQVTGAMKLTWHPKRKEVWAFQKEMSTSGAINTVDVLYPSSPQLLYTNPELLRICLLPLLVYCNNETSTKYNLSWPTHSLGVWPLADITPDGQEQLPLEVAADMLLMLAAVAQRQGNNVTYLTPFKTLIDTWGAFVKTQLPFPPKQLCTDDFEGPTSNNTNLVVKGIIALEAYAILQDMMNSSHLAASYRDTMNQDLNMWMEYGVASANPEESHFVREFGLNSSYSVKYNLIYQRILNVNIFSSSIIQEELHYYAYYYYTYFKDSVYGTPMDDRHPFTLGEYQGLLVALAEDSFLRKAFADQLFKFANITTPRYPLSDFYLTSDATNPTRRFIARPTWGDLFAVLLTG